MARIAQADLVFKENPYNHRTIVVRVQATRITKSNFAISGFDRPACLFFEGFQWVGNHGIYRRHSLNK